MSQTSTPAPELDPDELKRFSFTVWNYKMGELVSFMIYLGDELDLFSAMHDGGPMTSQSVADARNLNERFVREWLHGMAAARLLGRNEDGTFEMSDVAAAVLADEVGSVNFAAGAFRGGTDPVILSKLVDSFALPKVKQTLQPQPDVDPFRETPVFFWLCSMILINSISSLMKSIMHDEPFAGMPRI